MDIESNAADRDLAAQRKAFAARRNNMMSWITFAHMAISLIVFVLVFFGTLIFANEHVEFGMKFAYLLLFFPFSLSQFIFPSTTVLALVLASTSLFWGYVGSLLIIRR